MFQRGFSPEQPHQMVILGSGMKLGGLEPSNATVERVDAGRHHYDLYESSVLRVVLSTGMSSMAEGNIEDRVTEARAMQNRGEFPEDIVRLEEKSWSTASNLTESRKLLLPNLPTLLVAHKAHLPRAIFLGKKIIPTAVHGLAAEKYGGTPEPAKRWLVEAGHIALDGYFFRGVTPAEYPEDGDEIDQRADDLKSFKESIEPFGRVILLRQHEQYEMVDPVAQSASKDVLSRV